LLFKALVRPHLEYANSVRCPYRKADILSVENVQRRATKMLPSLKNMNYEERLRYSLAIYIYSWTVEQIGIDIFLLLKATQI
jgi:hypothetical protein